MLDDVYQGNHWKDRLDPIEEVEDMKMYVPWFLACNPERFPYWFGKPDPRNEVLRRGLQKFFQNKNHNLEFNAFIRSPSSSSFSVREKMSAKRLKFKRQRA